MLTNLNFRKWGIYQISEGKKYVSQHLYLQNKFCVRAYIHSVSMILVHEYVLQLREKLVTDNNSTNTVLKLTFDLSI